jgi:hypothetical protein
MTQGKPLCYAPFIGMYAASAKNEYAPCCVAKKASYSDPDSFWNSVEMKTTREKMLNHEWPSICGYCKDKSSKNLKNDIYIWDNAFNRNPIDININTGNATSRPMYLDYRPSNTCNLKCRMCVPAASSQWAKEIVDNPVLTKWYTVPKLHESNYNSFLEYMTTCELKQIKILGGEPTIDDYAIEFLEKIIKTHKTMPDLRFTTNATNLNKRFQRIMEHFKNIHVVFSIDATSDAFDYIRTNAKWSKVKKQIESIFKKNLATQYGFNSVLMPYNIFNIVELLVWYEELYKQGYEFSVFFDTSDVHFTSLRAVLPEDLAAATADVERFFSECDASFKKVTGIIDILGILKSTVFDLNSHNEFKEYNNTLDDIRKTNFTKIDERFIKYV